MKLPVSRRLSTWQSNIFNRNCPIGCNTDDTEEHAILFCKSAIIKNMKKYIFHNYQNTKNIEKITKF